MARNLKLWYPVEGDFTDYSGNSLNGTPAITGYAAGKFGLAGEFDGSDDVVTVPSGAAVAGLTQATVCAWVYCRNLPTTLLDEIYVEETSGGVPRFAIRLVWTAPGSYFSMQLRDGAGSNSVNGATYAATNTWYHVCGVFNADTDQHFVFLNGRQDGSSVIARAAIENSATAGITVGRQRAAMARQWDGYIDDVRLYLAALHESDVRRVMMGFHPLH